MDELVRGRVRLKDDEIRTGMIFAESVIRAEAIAATAEAHEQAYVGQLRARYHLGPEWAFGDWLTGFVRIDDAAPQVEPIETG